MLNSLDQGSMGEIEKMVIHARLDKLAWNRTHTAKSLQIGIRTLQRKMKSYDLLKFEPVKAEVVKPEQTETADANTAN